MKGWRSTFPSDRMYASSKFGRLPVGAQDLLLRFYSRCDKWGRGPGHERLLKQQLCLPTDYEIDGHLALLEEAGFIDFYEVEGETYYELPKYDDDSFPKLVKERGASHYPAKPKVLLAGNQTLLQLGPNKRANPQYDSSVSKRRKATNASAGATPAPIPKPSKTHEEMRHTESDLLPNAKRTDSALLDIDLAVDPAIEGCSYSAGAPVGAPEHAGARVQALAGAHARYEPEQPTAENPTADSAQPRPKPPPLDLTHEKPFVAPKQEWPSHDHEQEGIAWWQHFNANRNGFGFNGGYTWENVRSVAVRRPDEFIEASQYMRKGVDGWKRGDPFRFLEKICDQVVTRREDRAERMRHAWADASLPRSGVLAWPPGTEVIGMRGWGIILGSLPENCGELGDLQRVAMEHPGEFVEAMGVVLNDKRWPHGIDLLGWIRRECGFVQDRRRAAQRRVETASVTAMPADPSRLGPQHDDGPWMKWIRPPGMDQFAFQKVPKRVSAWWAIGGPDGASFIAHRDGQQQASRVVESQVMLAHYASKHGCTVEEILASEQEALRVAMECAPERVDEHVESVPGSSLGGRRHA